MALCTVSNIPNSSRKVLPCKTNPLATQMISRGLPGMGRLKCYPGSFGRGCCAKARCAVWRLIVAARYAEIRAAVIHATGLRRWAMNGGLSGRQPAVSRASASPS